MNSHSTPYLATTTWIAGRHDTTRAGAPENPSLIVILLTLYLQHAKYRNQLPAITTWRNGNDEIMPFVPAICRHLALMPQFHDFERLALRC